MQIHHHSRITVADHLIVQIKISIVRNEKSNLVWKSQQVSQFYHMTAKDREREFISHCLSVCLSVPLKNHDDDITDDVICYNVVALR